MPDTATSRTRLPQTPSAFALRATRSWGAPASAGIVQAKHDLGRIAVRPPTAGRGRQGRLPHGLRTGIERLSGIAMDDVTVHTDSPEPARYQALAYARGAEIHVAPGQERHLAHEAWHVVQQKQRRVRPTLRALGAPINDDRGLEAEAHTMGERALRAAPSGPAAGPAAPPVAAQPGWSVSAPAQLLVGQSRFNWGIWARGGGSIDDNQHLQDIHNALGRFHPEKRRAESRQAFANRRAQALDDATRGVHRYLGAMGDLNQGGMSRDYMMGMLDDLQEAHVQHIDYTHRHDLDLWSSENLNGQQRRQLQRDWNEIRGGRGTVRLPAERPANADGEVTARHRNNAENNQRTRASFARLMSRGEGRQLVRGLVTPSRATNGQPWRIDVSYTPRLTDAQRAEIPGNRAEWDRLRPAFEAARARRDAPGATPADYAEYIRLQQEAAPYMPGGDRRTDPEEAAAAGERGHGADLRILDGLRDSEFLNHSGVRTGLIAGGAHILTGHELVHALHYKQGTRRSDVQYPQGNPLHHWENLEERNTISTGPGPTENRLRDEHAMRPREGHTGRRRDEMDRDTRNRRLRAAAPYVIGAGALAYRGYRDYYG